MTHAITFCATCELGKGNLSDALAPPGFVIRKVECMSGCTRPSTVAFRAEGKTAYLFGEIVEADLPELHAFAEAYLASTDGTFADARIFGGLRMKAIARIPG